MVSPELSNM